MKPKKNKNLGIDILIAEDSATQAMQLAALLEERGYAVRTAADGRQALVAIRERRPTLVISDVIMPEMDGYELCRALKGDEATRDIPVVLVTTLSDAMDVIRGLECGADNFIRKPYDEHYLLARIEYLLTNIDLRKNQKMKVGVEINLGGQRHFITSERQQILDLLISTYEQAVQINTELVAREKQLDHSNRMLHGLYRIAEALNSVVSEREVAETVLARAMDLPGVRAGWISLRDGQSGFRLVATQNLPPALREPGALDGECRCRSKFLAGELDSVTNMLECERLQQAGGDTGGLKAHASVPIWVAGQPIGIMNLVGSGSGLFDEEDAKNLYAVGNQFGVSLARARLHENLERLVEERTAKLRVEVMERKRAQEEQARLVAILDTTPDFVATATPDGSPLYVNRAGLRMLGFAEDHDISTTRMADGHPEWARKIVLEQGIPHAIQHGVWSGETAFLTPDGGELPISQVILAHKDDSGKVEYLSTIARDISGRKAYEARIERLSRVHAVLSGINTTIVRVRERQELFDEACRIAVDAGKYVFAWIGLQEPGGESLSVAAVAGREEGYLEQLKLTAPLGTPGKYKLIAEALNGSHSVACNDIATDARMEWWREQALRRNYRSLAVLPLVLEGKPIGVFALYAPETGAFDDEEMRLLEEMASDVSFALDHLQKETRLNYLAYYDAVTGLPNRVLFRDRVEERMRNAREEQRAFSLIILDVVRFSEINDLLGRDGGDELLRQLAGHLKGILSETDILARVAADCFGIATRRSDEGAGIAHMLEAIMKEIGQCVFVVKGRELRIAARAGVAGFPRSGDDMETLYRNAEAALKNAKRLGERYLFYTPELNAQVSENLALENKLRHAIERKELVLHYQPKITLTSGQISGLEALMRWDDPERGLVPPLQFISVLEETGMILDAGRWAVEEAVAQSVRWARAGLKSPRVAVNISAIQLRQKDFVESVRQALHGAPGACLELEITESLIMHDIEANIVKIKALRDMGIEIAIDDFGTGYSSLSYIAKLPVSTLKIDRAFVKNMAQNPDDLGIVSTIISLAHSLKLGVVAEGVETAEQARLLRLLRCDEIQGYLVSHPVVSGNIETMVRENKTFLSGT